MLILDGVISPSFFDIMVANSIAFISFILFIWISYFLIRATVALRRLVLLASCTCKKVQFEEIVKAVAKEVGI